MRVAERKVRVVGIPIAVSEGNLRTSALDVRQRQRQPLAHRRTRPLNAGLNDLRLGCDGLGAPAEATARFRYEAENGSSGNVAFDLADMPGGHLADVGQRSKHIGARAGDFDGVTK